MFLETIGAMIPSIIDKIKGKSTPDSGTEAGQYSKDYFDTLAPGTSQWERIGSSTPTGSQVGARIGAEQQDKSLNKQLMSQALINRDTNRAHIVASGAQYGPEASEALLDVYDRRKSTPYDTPTKQSREKYQETGGKDAVRSGFERHLINTRKKVKSGEYWKDTKQNLKSTGREIQKKAKDLFGRRSTPRKVDIQVNPFKNN